MYIHEAGQLFEDVQLKNIFEDGKEFPDSRPKSELGGIVSEYEAARKCPEFNLKTFVLDRFDLPEIASNAYFSDPNMSAISHIEALWTVLRRSAAQQEQGTSLIELPKDYIVPGGRFREIYYWDSYFTMLGLRCSKQSDIIENMLDNFAFLIDKYGYIPNGNRTYFLGRSQPPLFALMVDLLAGIKGPHIYQKYLNVLRKEYDFWMSGQDRLSEKNRAIDRTILMPNGAILNRFWDRHQTPRPESFREDVHLSHKSDQNPKILYRHIRAAAESGWDFSSRWLSDELNLATIHTCDLVPVDLNCELYFLETTLSKAYEHAKDNEKSRQFAFLAERRKNAIKTFCWNKQQKFFVDYDHVKNEQKNTKTLAASVPLFFGIATKKQAAAVCRSLESGFLKQGGLITTLTKSGQQWDSPNGWAPLHWFAYKGACNYGFNQLAEKIRTRWIRTVTSVYEQERKMTEKYDVLAPDSSASGGEYPNQDGFGWTNAIYLALTS